MSILSIMKFDEVKLDKPSMDDLAANRTNQTVVKCIIDMCHSLQVECVAEGVENQEQLELLDFLWMYRHSGLLLQQASGDRGI